jgi:hypothetical protein
VHLAQGGEIEFRVGVAAFRSSQSQYEFPRFFHVRCINAVSQQLQSEIGLDRGAQVGLAARILRPGSIGGSLLGPKMIRDLGQTRVVFLFDDVFQQDVFALKDGISLEFGTPESGFVLCRNEALRGARQG